MTAPDEGLLTPADDDFHAPPSDAPWWFHETCWFWFHVPERRLGGWIYHWIRPVIGVTGGGCWLWDDSAVHHWEAPYYANHNNLRLPEERNLRDFTFPTGLRLTALEPLTQYRLQYADGDLIAFDLVFDAVMEPWVSRDPEAERPHHLDQFGRVHGTLVLHGSPVSVDCIAIRDRTWATRSERWRDGGGWGYTSAAARSGEAFLAIGDVDGVRGFFADGGDRAGLVAGSRHVERDPAHGYPNRVVVAATDSLGRSLDAEGVAVSRMVAPIPGVHGLVWTTLVEWTINGRPAWGDDQEPWSLAGWAAARRERRL